MKQFLTLVLALAMVLSLAACGSKKPVQLTADGGAVVVLSADANNAVTSLSVAFRKQLAAKLGGEVQLNYDNKLDEKASGTRVLIGQTSQAASTALYAQLAQAGGSRFGLLAADGCLAVGGTNEYLTYEALDYLLTTILGSGGLTLEDGYSYLSDERPGCPDVREMLAAGRTPAFIAADIVCTVPKTDGYTVMQGGGTDGTYAFFGMIDSSQDPSLVRLYKYSLADWSQVLVSEPIELAHCNDITYDSVNKRLVISRCTKTDGYLGLNFVDPETLQLTGSAETAFRQSRVAYLPESDGYVFGMEGEPTVTRTDAAFNPISTFETPLTDKISQGFFWDGQYIYDIRYYSGSASHRMVIDTPDGENVAIATLSGVDGEPENIFRAGDTFYLGCNRTSFVYSLVLAPDGWWQS